MASGPGAEFTVLAQDVNFVNATESSGFFSLPNFGGHGVQVVDVDGDGWLDVYVTHIADETQNRPDLLFVNQRQSPPRLVERGREAGVADDGFYNGRSEESHAAVFADFDGDGDFDLFNAHTWNGHDRLYRNEGDLRFVDLSESAGIEVTDLGTRGVGAADFNRDGRMDIVVSAWQGAQPIIYWNLGNLFFDRQRIKGVDNRPFANQGITVADYDGDLTPDLGLTAYEFLQEEGAGPIALLSNDGTGRFTDATDYAGISYERGDETLKNRGSNGWSFADVDNDSDLDALIVGSHGSKLYRQKAPGRFVLAQSFAGLAYTGAFGDVDNDGDQDLYLAGESGIHLNDGRGRFGYLGGLLEGVGLDARSAVFADMNNDGALDLLIASKQGPNTFFLNQTARSSWIQLALLGRSGEAGAFGARLSLYEAGHAGDPAFLRGFREVRGATGYCSQDPPVLHFGAGAAMTYDVLVRYADGSELTRSGIQPGQLLRIDPREP